MAAFEILLVTPRMSDLIRNGAFEDIHEHMDKEANLGMQTMDQALYNLYNNNTIPAETALEYAKSYRDMRLRMRFSTVTANLNN